MYLIIIIIIINSLQVTQDFEMQRKQKEVINRFQIFVCVINE